MKVVVRYIGLPCVNCKSEKEKRQMKLCYSCQDVIDRAEFSKMSNSPFFSSHIPHKKIHPPRIKKNPVIKAKPVNITKSDYESLFSYADKPCMACKKQTEVPTWKFCRKCENTLNTRRYSLKSYKYTYSPKRLTLEANKERLQYILGQAKEELVVEAVRRAYARL